MNYRNEKVDVVCLSFTSWDGNYVKSSVKLMQEVALIQRVVYIDYPYTWKDVLNGILKKNKYIPWKRVVGIHDRVRKVKYNSGGLSIVSLPPTIPFNWIRSERVLSIVLSLNAWVIRKSLQSILRSMRLDNIVLVSALNPIYGNKLVDKLGEKLSLYYCYDEISAANWIKVHGARAERDFLRKTDVVITSSSALMEKKKVLNSKCYVVNNGVDPMLISQEPFDIKENIKRSDQKKVIGFLGTIDDRIDYDLMHKLISNFSEHEIQFVGRVNSQAFFETFNVYQNVVFKGAQPEHDLKHFLKVFDIGIIPFVVNEFTSGIYPMKVNEYLGAGIPVVSTRFGDMDVFRDIAHVCGDHESFISAIGHELRTPLTLASRSKKVEVARQNTWDKRAQQFISIIQKELQDKERV